MPKHYVAHLKLRDHCMPTVIEILKNLKKKRTSSSEFRHNGHSRMLVDLPSSYWLPFKRRSKFKWETHPNPKCQIKFSLPIHGIPEELLQVHLLLPQGSKRRLTLHKAFASDVQLDLPQCRLDGPTHVVFKLPLVFHKVRLHDHWRE